MSKGVRYLLRNEDVPANRYEENRILTRRFNEKHPGVWRMFDRYTKDRIERGFKRYSADAIMHRIRWETAEGASAEERESGEVKFKITNDFVAHYAAEFVRRNPECAGFFIEKEKPTKREPPRFQWMRPDLFNHD